MSTTSSQLQRLKQKTPHLMLPTQNSEDGIGINSGEVVLYKPSLVGEDGFLRTFGKDSLQIRRGSEASNTASGISPVKFT